MSQKLILCHTHVTFFFSFIKVRPPQAPAPPPLFVRIQPPPPLEQAPIVIREAPPPRPQYIPVRIYLFILSNNSHLFLLDNSFDQIIASSTCSTTKCSSTQCS